MQVQQQLLVSGRKFAYIGALVGGNRVALLKREPEAKIQEAIRREAVAFWKSIEANQPPSPDFVRDSEFIKRLCSRVEEGKSLDVKGKFEWNVAADDYKTTSELAKKADDAKEAAKAKLRLLLGDAVKATGDTFTLSSTMVGESPISYVRPAYRTFNVNFKKPKGDK